MNWARMTKFVEETDCIFNTVSIEWFELLPAVGSDPESCVLVNTLLPVATTQDPRSPVIMAFVDRVESPQIEVLFTNVVPLKTAMPFVPQYFDVPLS